MQNIVDDIGTCIYITAIRFGGFLFINIQHNSNNVNAHSIMIIICQFILDVPHMKCNPFFACEDGSHTHKNILNLQTQKTGL